MRFGRVIGRTVFSRQDPAYNGGRFLVVSPMTRKQLLAGLEDDSQMVSEIPSVVVYDNLGAGTGDVIGFVEGAEATAPFESPIPIDAFSAAIFDQITYQPPVTS
ncbi:EutN/CcmL family microcompartment protein [Rubellicoccus peritrichatus]|uniref:EutN/CcmL family microcompartment protein n=1 Tax=Rubellicoccus peritrichatus TaxID=3080537 RepID=A0AAQ3L909_9BACT|nr:EutN/CcmL family microcompartment protein [Puniceicoccus sp. CR14]WOO41570.1 EutN/CcmL family microcompartment protein [Puniceicoccus sp. CR14]